MLVDSGLYLSGVNPVFDFRTSGQPSDILFGNPTMSMIDDFARGSKGLVQPFIDGRQRSQQEYRNMMRSLPLQNWLPIGTLLSTMVQNQPEYPPKR